MSNKKAMFMRGGAAPLLYNLSIGNVADIIPDAATLATKFSFDAVDVTYFNIVGNDIQAFIDNTGFPVGTTYTHNVSAFAATLITFIRETDGLWEGGVDLGFDNCDSLTEVFTTATTFKAGQRTYRSCSFLKPENITINNIDFTGTNLSAFENISWANSTFDLTNQTSVINSGQSTRNMFRGGVATTIIDLRNVTTMTITGASNIRYIFDNCNAKIRLWSLTTFQTDPSVQSGVFGIVATSKIIEINVAQQTANAGGVHAELVQAIALGATVVYTDSSGTPI